MFVSSIIYQSIYIREVLETSPKKQKTICNFCNFPIGNKKPKNLKPSAISAIKVGCLGYRWHLRCFFFQIRTPGKWKTKSVANPFAHHKKSHSEGTWGAKRRRTGKKLLHLDIFKDILEGTNISHLFTRNSPVPREGDMFVLRRVSVCWLLRFGGFKQATSKGLPTTCLSCPKHTSGEDQKLVIYIHMELWGPYK